MYLLQHNALDKSYYIIILDKSIYNIQLYTVNKMKAIIPSFVENI